MAIRGVAKRYAQAVFDMATESGTQDQWLADLITLVDAVSDRVGGEFLTSPNVSELDKRAVIGQLLPGDERRYARNLAVLLVQRRRFDVVPELLEVYRDLLLQAQGIAIANVTTAVDLTPAEREQIRTQLQQIVGKEIELRATTDPSLIGGLVARIGDRLIDASVTSQLQQMRASLAR